jgi:hypothetical protein
MHGGTEAQHRRQRRRGQRALALWLRHKQVPSNTVTSVYSVQPNTNMPSQAHAHAAGLNARSPPHRQIGKQVLFSPSP